MTTVHKEYQLTTIQVRIRQLEKILAQFEYKFLDLIHYKRCQEHIDVIQRVIQKDHTPGITKLRCTVIDGTNLKPCKLKGGLVRIGVGTDIKSTKLVKGTLFPVWNEEMLFNDIGARREMRVALVSKTGKIAGYGIVDVDCELASQLLYGPVQMEVRMKTPKGKDGGIVHLELHGQFLGDPDFWAPDEDRRRKELAADRARLREVAKRRGLEWLAKAKEAKLKAGTTKKRATATMAGGFKSKQFILRPWIGVEIKLLDDMLGHKNCVVVVHSVKPDSPAAKAGVLPEDIVEFVGSERMLSKYDWDNTIKNLSIGSKVTLKLVRQGRKFKIPVVVGNTQRNLKSKHVKTSTRSDNYIMKGGKKTKTLKGGKKGLKVKVGRKAGKKGIKKRTTKKTSGPKGMSAMYGNVARGNALLKRTAVKKSKKRR